MIGGALSKQRRVSGRFLHSSFSCRVTARYYLWGHSYSVNFWWTSDELDIKIKAFNVCCSSKTMCTQEAATLHVLQGVLPHHPSDVKQMLWVPPLHHNTTAGLITVWSLHFTGLVPVVHTRATRLLSQNKNEGCTCGPRRETSTLNYVWRWIPH